MLDLFHIALPFLLIPLTARAWRRFGIVAGMYGALTAATGILIGGDSLGREALAVVPAFAAAGLTKTRPAATFWLRTASLALLVTFAYAFVTGQFMG